MSYSTEMCRLSQAFEELPFCGCYVGRTKTKKCLFNSLKKYDKTNVCKNILKANLYVNSPIIKKYIIV